MHKKILSIVATMLIAAACNNNPEKTAASNTDTASHEMHDHAATTTPSAEIPPVPAIP